MKFDMLYFLLFDYTCLKCHFLHEIVRRYHNAVAKFCVKHFRATPFIPRDACEVSDS